MHLIVIHNNSSLSAGPGDDLLRLAASSELIAEITFAGLYESCCFDDTDDTIIAVPREWQADYSWRHTKIVYDNGNIPVPLNTVKRGKTNRWFVLSNGRFVTGADSQRLYEMLANFNADLIAVSVDEALLSYHEKVRITSCGNVAGFRRLYSDSVLPVPMPKDWPNHIFIKPDVLGKILADGTLPPTFAEFVSRFTSNSLKCHSIKVGGTVLNLETEVGLLRLLTARLPSMHYYLHYTSGQSYYRTSRIAMPRNKISTNARLFGKVLLADNVQIGDDAVIVGPTIIGNNVKIAPAAVIRASVIGPGLSVPKGCFVQNRILIGRNSQHELLSQNTDSLVQRVNVTNPPFIETGLKNSNFRIWPRFSYARCTKRVADIIAALVVLMLFAPVFPVIAIVIKLNSPGPVFFKDRRQGLYGKQFPCLKFRTMFIGAEKIQEKLRFKSQVDGPQFKMETDPRITIVGKFLRDTYIDEIPQFINILIGQMSVVGPRPSPEAENLLCPLWRDARLSVRPGITGLWQIYRTRQVGRDFQEWIYYDTRYIRNLSLWLDLLICLKTAKKLITNFINQF